MSPRLSCDVSGSVWRAIKAEQEQTGDSLSQVVERILSTAFQLDRHTLFQVSTSNALVQGVFRGATTLADLRRHGDFGLGTFEGLDGELIMLDGGCYRATGGGEVTVPDDGVGVPFAVVTRFNSDVHSTLDAGVSLDELNRSVDQIRPSENLFAGIRVEGGFEALMLRAACPAAPGEGLVEATRHQSEFSATDVEGTLVGFWSPLYARAVNVPGYHFHFIASDRSLGGHVLDLRAGRVEVDVHIESDLHIAIPETAEFLEADLSGEHTEALHQAETAIHPDG